MFDVLLVSANQERLPDPVPPLGAMYVAGAAREAGHRVHFYDACFAGQRAAQELTARLEEIKPQVVGLSIRNVDNVAWPHATSYLPHYRALVAAIRAAAPGATLVMGGSAFTLFPEAFMEELGADYGVAGEAEALFVELLSQLEQHGRLERPPPGTRGRVLYPSPGLARFDVRPARDLVQLDRYYREGGSANLQTKRGCVFRCSYCTYPLLEGGKVRAREPAQVVDEIEEVQRRHGVGFFFFVDNVFNSPASHAAAIAEELIRRRTGIAWTAYLSPAGCTRELLELMARSGCQSVDFGTDAVSAAMLERYRKAFGVQDVLEASRWCREVGLKFNHSLILGGPGETWDSVKETVANTLASRPTSVIAVMGVRLYRGVAAAEQAIAEGHLTAEQIGLDPVFHVEEAVREGLPAYLEALAGQHPNWVVPGLKKGLNQRLFDRMRARGVKGPLWQLLEPT